jgi:ribosomal RNA-processing protein 8
MLGGKHFQKKFEKKQAKKAKHHAAKKQPDGSKKSLSAAIQSSSVAVAAAAGKPPSSAGGQLHPAAGYTKSTNRSTLKGPVVQHAATVGLPSWDSGNVRKQVAPGQQQLQGQSGASGKQNKRLARDGLAPAQVRAELGFGSSSKTQRKAYARVHGDALLDSFKTKLTASTFRLLNEQVYSSPNAFAGQLLRDPTTFGDYHEGYRAQLRQWPVNPNQLIIDSILKDKRGRFCANKSKALQGYTPTSWVIADMGCGDAQVAAALRPAGYTVHSFDFCAANDLVTVASSTAVPLERASVDVCVFSLSLMATDFFDSLLEAHRILKPKRLLKVIEVRSRIPHPQSFAELVEGIGFSCDWCDVAGDYFVAFDFIRNDAPEANIQPYHNPGDVLLPSLYKKR